jgi:Flp pilus assembly pilin Flp
MDMRGAVNGLHRASTTCLRVTTRFAAEDGGQDLLEYALLAAFIGIAAWAVLLTLPGVIGATYASWLDPTNGVPGRWDPPEPGAGS